MTVQERISEVRAKARAEANRIIMQAEAEVVQLWAEARATKKVVNQIPRETPEEREERLRREYIAANS